MTIKDLHGSHPADALFSRVDRGYQCKFCCDYRYLSVDFLHEMCYEADELHSSTVVNIYQNPSCDLLEK